MSILLKDKLISSNPLEIAECFNEHLATAPSLIGNAISPAPSTHPEDNILSEEVSTLFKLSDQPITNEEVLGAVGMLEAKHSCDSNGISMNFLKKCINNLVNSICHLFNLSFSKGIVQSQFKIAKIIPVFKSCDSLSPNNYRPIAILDNFS